MTIQNFLSICLFALFVIMVLVRAAILRKRGVRVIVFGQTDKSDFLLVPFVLSIAYTALARTFGLPIWAALIHPLWESNIISWIGLVLCIISNVGFILTLVSFGNSFRVGIDESNPDKLITTGMFSISRNPIYVCFLMFFAGLFLIHCNIVIAIATILFSLVIHRQVLREERFLKSHYGNKYNEYYKNVRRYL